MSKPRWNLKHLNFLSTPVLLLLAVIVLLPLLVVFLTSFAPPVATPNLLSKNGWSFANYRDAWQRGNFLLAFANSTLLALAVTAFQILTSALAGYALARLEYRGRQVLLLIVIAMLVIPVFLVLKLGQPINTYWALILPTPVNGCRIFCWGSISKPFRWN